MLGRVAKATPLQLTWKSQIILKQKEVGQRLPAPHGDTIATDKALDLVHQWNVYEEYSMDSQFQHFPQATPPVLTRTPSLDVHIFPPTTTPQMHAASSFHIRSMSLHLWLA